MMKEIDVKDETAPPGIEKYPGPKGFNLEFLMKFKLLRS